MILKKIRNKVSGYFGKPAAKKSGPVYPFIHEQLEYDVRFHINNHIENFRLKNWGGEKEYVMALVNELKPNDVFFDIGSSVGLISITVAKKLVSGKVFSFEPDPENALRLKNNYQLNGLNNFEVLQMAVGEGRSQMQLFTAGSNGYSPSLKKVNGIDAYINVEVDSIDNLIEEKKIPKPTVIKIDIEGAEMMALKGMKELLTMEDKPRLIYLEVHPEFLPSFNTSSEEILHFLSGLDYTLVEKVEREKQLLCKLIRKN